MFASRSAVCLSVVALAALAPAQQGDRPNDPQQPLPPGIVPPAAVRDPVTALAAMRVPAGFAVEPFAAEPFVQDPVAAAFDADGRLWVVEMRGFMTDVDGRGEREPTGCIAVLQDRDGDGRADLRSVFLAGVALPRAVLPLRGGALVIAPPNLCWCPDANGDLQADRCTPIADGFGAGLDNPEHAGNGLVWGLDHRIHLAGERRTWRWTPAGFVVELGAGGGQWGITHDDRGRFYFDYNEDWLRCDLVPATTAVRVTGQSGLVGLNHRLVPSRTVWPCHRTPGVNRGYQPGKLRDYVLTEHTAVCGPCVYRGDLLPGCDGDVFVCEPAANAVRRIVLADGDGVMHGDNAYEAEQREFLATDDERFRPVNLLGGPDGALYVVDMYRGVIQHRNFLTTFLRQQILDRGLAEPTGLGRIWRVVPAVGARRPVPHLAAATPEALVAALASPTGAVRDVALRELVQQRFLTALTALREQFATAASPAVRIATLAALDGLDGLRPAELTQALADADAGVRGAALERSVAALAADDAGCWQRAVACGARSAAERWRLAFALGEVATVAPAAAVRARAVAAFDELVAGHADDAMLREQAAAIAARGGSTLSGAFVARFAAAPEALGAPALQAFARACLLTRTAAIQADLLAAIGRQPAPWQRLALLEGAVRALPAKGRANWLAVRELPASLVELAEGGDGRVGELARAVREALSQRAAPAPLDPAGRALVERGSQLYPILCGACHQADGAGQPGLAPPLRDSAWLQGAGERVVRIALHGLRGPIEVGGAAWALEMPPQRHLDDETLAAVVSYARQTFAGGASVVDAATVAAVRAATATRSEPWTAADFTDPEAEQGPR